MITHRHLFLPVLSGLVIMAWLTLWFWEQSPYGRYLSHTELGTIGLDSETLSVLGQAGLYIIG